MESKKGRFHTSKMDCDILLTTITNCLPLVGENGLRGYSPNMSQIIAYLRTSTDKQDLNNQKLEILEWAHKSGILDPKNLS